MSTNATYTFIDRGGIGGGNFHVYKHCDGYPKGAVNFIKAAFETGATRANELAVAFIVANKQPNTGCELINYYDEYSDLAYRYEIDQELTWGEAGIKRKFIISAFKRTSASSFLYGPAYDLIFRGSLNEFEKFAEKNPY